MIIDSSAAAAVCFGEPDADAFAAAMELTDSLAIGAVTYAEAAIVIDARRPGAFDAWINGLEVEVIPVDRELAEAARSAYTTYGRGSGHPARLNFGDCFSFALAHIRQEPLLFKGDDFAHTDVVSGLGGLDGR